MKYLRLCIITLILCFTMVLTACSGKSSGEAATETTADMTMLTVTDLIGREVTVTPGSYQRVVCIGAGALRMYSYIGDITLLCGVEDIDNTSLPERPKMFDSDARPYVLAYSEVFQKLPSCGVGGPNAQAAEAEKIISCNPDIIISLYGDVEKEDALQEQVGVPVITLKSGPSGVFAEDFTESIELLGVIFNETDKAGQLISFIEKEKNEISDRTAIIPEEEKPSVYICGLGNWGTANHLTTAETYSTFEVAHVKNAVSGLGMKGIGEIEEEKFVSIGPETDIIIIDEAAIKNISPLYEQNPTMFDSFKAWKNGEIYLQMPYNAYYTNYEIALCNAWFIAKTVYPEQFRDVDITEKMNEITKAFLGKELADDIYSCETNYYGYQKIDPSAF